MCDFIMLPEYENTKSVSCNALQFSDKKHINKQIIHNINSVTVKISRFNRQMDAKVFSITVLIIVLALGQNTVFSSPSDDDYTFYPAQLITDLEGRETSKDRRFQGIPGVEVFDNGRLWAVWFGGGHGEDCDNYVILATSSDNGLTWKEKIHIDYTDSEMGAKLRSFDPAIWRDPLGRMWVFWAQSKGWWDGRGGVWAAISENPQDEMPAFSEPFRLCDGVVLNKPTVLSNGLWALPVAQWAGIKSFVAHPAVPEERLLSNMFVSADQGKTWHWQGGAKIPETDHDENTIIERKDGSLWMLARTRYGCGESFSFDGGKTWTEGKPTNFENPTARLSIGRLASGRILLVKNGPLDERTERIAMTAYLSDDDGKSWYGGLVLDERDDVSYPNAAQAEDGSIYVVYDRRRYSDKEILMARFTEEDVAAGKCVSDEAALKLLVNKSSGKQAPVRIEPESRTFKDSLDITLRYPVRVKVRYTLDGTDPARSPATKSGMSPVRFTIDKTTVVKAKVLGGQFNTPTVTETFSLEGSDEHSSTCSSSSDDDYTFYPAQLITDLEGRETSKDRRFQGIPSVEVFDNGRLWAVWFGGGYGEDCGNYVILATSSDNGLAWKESIHIDYADPEMGAQLRTCDPTIWRDPLGRMWVFWTQVKGWWDGRGGVWAAISENPQDDMPTFSEPFRLCDGVSLNKPTVLSNGLWALPVAQWAGIKAFVAHPAVPEERLLSNMFVSADQGKTWHWQGGAKIPETDHDENTIIERKDGSLWMLARTRYGCGESFSFDAGKTWTEGEPTNFENPTARLSIGRLASGRILLVKNGPLNERTERIAMTAYLSDDDGKSWYGGLVLDERDDVSYPNAAQAEDGSIYVVYDRRRYSDKEILMARFTEEDVAAGKCVSDEAALKLLVNKSCGQWPPVEIHPKSQTFKDSLDITLRYPARVRVCYTLDGTDPVKSPTRKLGVSPFKFTIDKTAVIKAGVALPYVDTPNTPETFTKENE
jgi:predicted neuraminidase